MEKGVSQEPPHFAVRYLFGIQNESVGDRPPLRSSKRRQQFLLKRARILSNCVWITYALENCSFIDCLGAALGGELKNVKCDVNPNQPFADPAAWNQRIEIAGAFLAII